MVKHASSHGLSVFVCTIISSFLIELLKPLLPKVFEKVDSYSSIILEYIPLPISGYYLSILILASLLGIIWGRFFKLRFVKD